MAPEFADKTSSVFCKVTIWLLQSQIKGDNIKPVKDCNGDDGTSYDMNRSKWKSNDSLLIDFAIYNQNKAST